MNKVNKIIAIFLAIHLILGGIAPVFAEAPEASEASEVEEIQEDDDKGAPEVEEITENDSQDLIDSSSESSSEQTPNSNPGVSPNSQGQSSNGGSGDTYINTGDATSEGNIFNDANLNVSDGSTGCCGGDVSVVNDGNGSNSSNTGSANIVDNNTTNQDNSANIDNGLSGASVTGQNSASNNVGGDSYINTGDAKTTGTIITAANTNVDGVAVSEFNIVDDHVGDFILDFGSNCISGCDGFGAIAANSNNGTNSDNDATINSDTNNTTNQTNNADVNNDLSLTADSGNNTASGNTGGDSYITTGAAEVAGNVLTFLNNNLAGNVIFGVVNIFGDLIGDIILPESALNTFACATCGGNTTVANTGNGENSDNAASSNQTVNNTYNQLNNADINNNLILDATTGGNSASGNTNGDVYIRTGGVNVLAQVLNVANTNLIGGDMWLVIINRAGQWIGQIIGAPEGSLFAGSEGTEFIVDNNGQITAVNSGNGAGSTNNASVDSTTNNTTNQTNSAVVNNNIHLDANTGKNSANDNTKGDNYITTGDAEVIANIVNFVNNNIAGGRLLVTFVNVFGNWTGNFFTPDNPKATTQEQANASGGLDNNAEQSNNDNSGGNSQGSSNLVGASNNQNSSNLIAVLGFFGGSNNGPNINTNNNQSSLRVKIPGVNNNELLSDLIAGAKENKKMRINLAWAVLALPLFGAAILARRRIRRI